MLIYEVSQSVVPLKIKHRYILLSLLQALLSRLFELTGSESLFQFSLNITYWDNFVIFGFLKSQFSFLYPAGRLSHWLSYLFGLLFLPDSFNFVMILHIAYLLYLGLFDGFQLVLLFYFQVLSICDRIPKAD